MNCVDWEERIALYAGGDLDAQDAAVVERHLRDCAGCQVFASGLKESLACLQAAHAEEIAPAHYTALRARVMASVARERRRWRWAWIRILAAAALALLFVEMRPHGGGGPPGLSQASISSPATVGQGFRPAAGFPAAAPRRSAASARKGRATRKPQPHTEQVLIKLETNDPDVVIFWIADTKGEN